MANTGLRAEVVKAAARDAIPPGASMAERVAIAATILIDASTELSAPSALGMPVQVFIAQAGLLHSGQTLIPVIDLLARAGR